MRRRWVLSGSAFLVCAAGVALFTAEPDAPRVERPRNVVLVSIDTLRADHLDLYGYRRETAPRMRDFFREGTVFENAMTSAPCTLPAVRQFLSGTLDPESGRPSVAEPLQRAGYETAAFVSQHKFRQDEEWDYERGFQLFDLQARDDTDQHGMSTRTADDVTNAALRWLRARREERPFFLWVHYFDPHDPYEPPPSHRLFDAGNDSSRSGDRRTVLKQEQQSSGVPWQQAGEVFDEEDVEHLRNLYDGEIRFVDAQLGRLFEELEAREWIESTIVIVTADHGEWLGEDDRWDHCQTLAEEEIRVPLLLRVAGRPLDGVRRHSIAASTLDVVPTLADLLGLTGDSMRHDGSTLVGATRDHVARAAWNGAHVARKGPWKLQVHDGRKRLFRIPDDPTEEHDLAPEQPKVAASLAERIDERRDLLERASRTSEEVLEDLRSLGYL